MIDKRFLPVKPCDSCLPYRRMKCKGRQSDCENWREYVSSLISKIELLDHIIELQAMDEYSYIPMHTANDMRTDLVAALNDSDKLVIDSLGLG